MSDAVEFFAVPDTYVDDIAQVEILGPNVRITYTSKQNGRAVVVAKIVRPIASVHGKLRHMITEAALAAAHPTDYVLAMFH